MLKLGLKHIVVTIFLALSVSCVFAEGVWTPGLMDEAPFDELPSQWKKASGFLYLDGSCKLVALIWPEAYDVKRYLPDNERVNKKWWQRLNRLPNPASCKPLEWRKLSPANGSTYANACDPTAALSPSEEEGLFTAVCIVPYADVKYLIVLDDDFKPLTILDAPLSKEFAPSAIPAKILARQSRPSPACSPAMPPPCPQPPNGSIWIDLGGGFGACKCIRP